MFPDIDGDNDEDGNGVRSGLDAIAGFIDGLGEGAMEMMTEDDCTGVGTDTAVGCKTDGNAGEDPSGGPGE